MTVKIWHPTKVQLKELTQDIKDERDREYVQEYETDEYLNY